MHFSTESLLGILYLMMPLFCHPTYWHCSYIKNPLLEWFLTQLWMIGLRLALYFHFQLFFFILGFFFAIFDNLTFCGNVLGECSQLIFLIYCAGFQVYTFQSEYQVISFQKRVLIIFSHPTPLIRPLVRCWGFCTYCLGFFLLFYF